MDNSQYFLPNPIGTPTTESLCYTVPVVVVRVQVSPRCTCPQNPEDVVDKPAVVYSIAAPGNV